MNKEVKKAKYRGELDLAGFKIPCYVLNGERYLSNSEMQVALKMVDENDKQKSGTRLGRYLSQKSLKPFLYKEKEPGHYNPTIFYDGNKKVSGRKATLLVDICDAFLGAREEARERKKKKKGYLPPRQEIIAKQCEILTRAFAKTGIIALVDEATGYQKVRDEFELQKMLKAYISEETLEWQKTFHNSFYEQLYRLWKVPHIAKRTSKNNPWFFGTLTNELVYKKLPKGVLEALKIKTPKSKRFHQSLTPEIGREHLKKQIHSVEAYAKISDTKEGFLKFVEKAYPFQQKLSSKKLDEQQAQEVDFDKALKNAINTPPFKLKELKENLKKRTEEKKKIQN